MRGMTGVAVAVATALAGCGAAQHPTASSRVVAAAAAKTTRASTAHFSDKLKGSFNGKSLGTGWAKGVVDASRRRIRFRFDLTFLANASKKLYPGFLKGTVVLHGDTAFVTGPTIALLLPTGKRWAKATADEVSGGPGWVNFAAVDPTKPVDHFRAAVGTPEVLGTEKVDGVLTKHYRTQIDYRLYISLVPRSRRAGLEKGLAKIERIVGGTRLPAEAWIAPDGTIRRAKGIVAGRGLRLEYSREITAIGKPARIAPPARTRVVDVGKP